MALYLLACRNEIIPGQETLSGRETIKLGNHIIFEQDKKDEMPEIENQIIEKSKRTICRSVAEGESATNADIIEEFYNLTKFTTK